MLDGKFKGTVYRSRDNQVVDDEQWMVFLAKDNAVPQMLAFYRNRCVELGAGEEQIKSVDRLIDRVHAWRQTHHELCKVPDAEPGETP